MGVQQIAFHLTDRCQLDCKHCLRDPAQKPADLPFEVLVSALDQVKRLHGTAHVALTGGEPTLYPQFFEAIDAIAERDLSWHMVTNGRRFGAVMEELVRTSARRRSLDRIYLSLDGADEATHDRIRGEGSFREVLTACTHATVHGVPFILQLVVNALNHSQIEAVALLAAQLGAAEVSFVMLQPTGTQHDRELGLSAAEWHTVNDRLDRLASTLKIPIRTPEGWPQKQPFHVCEPFQSKLLHIDVGGRLNLCCQHAGIPQAADPASGESDIVADLASTSLVDAHERLLGVIHRAQAARLRQAAAGELGAWDLFPCNWCLGHFGKPHWTDDGAAGPEADRERWVGARGEPKGQAPRTRLPIVRK